MFLFERSERQKPRAGADQIFRQENYGWPHVPAGIPLISATWHVAEHSVKYQNISVTPQNFTVSEGGRRLLNTYRQELNPSLIFLRNALIDIHELRLGKFEYIYSKKLTAFNNTYEENRLNFFIISRKIETPDIILEGLSSPEDIGGYMQFIQMVDKDILRGFQYIEIIDRVLETKKQHVFNLRSIFFSLVAILIGLVSFFK